MRLYVNRNRSMDNLRILTRNKSLDKSSESARKRSLEKLTETGRIKNLESARQINRNSRQLKYMIRCHEKIQPCNFHNWSHSHEYNACLFISEGREYYDLHYYYYRAIVGILILSLNNINHILIVLTIETQIPDHPATTTTTT